MPCEELNLKSVIETSEKLEGREFVRSAQKNDVDDHLKKNVTLFLPTDAAFTEFAEQMLESVIIFICCVTRIFCLIIQFSIILIEFGRSPWIKSSSII